MSKTLVVHDTATNTLESLDPGSATAIGIPAFAIGNALPAAGQVVGEGFLVAPTKTGYLWDGTRWLPIVPSALLNYPTDAAVLADTSQQPGSYATSQATGNLFISAAGGVWHQVGVRSYALEATMRVDLNALEGDLAWTQDSNQLWYYNAGKWWAVGTRYYADEPTLLADGVNNAGGAIACAQDTGALFSMNAANGQWSPLSIVQYPDEPTMRLKSMNNVVGQIAIASNKIFVWSGTAWVGDPLSYYALEASIWTFDAPLGVLAIAGDTQAAWIKIAAGTGADKWKRLQGPNLSVGTAAPTTNTATGDLFFNLATNELSVRGATAWNPIGGGCKVAATAPTAPNAGAMWYDTTLKVLKTWDGTAWVVAYDDLWRLGDGHYKVHSATTTAGMDFANVGSAKDYGFMSRTSPDNGPAFWVQGSGNFMEVATSGVVTFPHGIVGVPKLVGKKVISHHMYVTNTWETTHHNISALTTWIPFGNLFKLEVVASGISYHGGDFEVRTDITGHGGASSQHRELNDGDNPSSKSLYHALTGSSGAGITPNIVIQSYSTASNADRIVQGYILLWDLGPAASIPDLT